MNIGIILKSREKTDQGTVVTEVPGREMCILQAAIASDDTPGEGENVLQEGEGRFWTNLSGMSFFVLRVGAEYKLVELS